MKRKRKPTNRTPGQNGLAPAFKLEPVEWRFLEEYLISMDVDRAASVAGLTVAYARRLMVRPEVERALAQARAFRSARTAVYADEVLRRWWLLATADVNELVELRMIACRHCHGVDHQYQYMDHEHRAALQEHKAHMLKIEDESKRVPFDELGGAGYNFRLEPVEDCPACAGDGIPHVVFKDSRKLSPGARLLYDGVERTKDGIKLKMRDRAFAEQMLAKHLGLLNEQQPIRTFDPEKMTVEELDAVLDTLPPELRAQAIAVVEGEFEVVDEPTPAGSEETT